MDRRPALRSLARPTSLAQQAYERIRAGLLPGGELDTTDRLVEQELAERLRMSRTPIRDALHRLALTGYLEPAGSGGYVRRLFTTRDAREHYELRQLLEPVAAELAARRDPEIRQRAVRELLAPSASGPGYDQVRFHLGIVALTGNSVLLKVVTSINERLAGFGVFITDRAAVERVGREHDEITDLIRRGAADDARDLMAAHLAFAERAIVQRLTDPLSTGPRGARQRRRMAT